MLDLLQELSISQIQQTNATSNLTQGHLDYRMTQGYSDISVKNAIWNTRKEFIEVNFSARSTTNSRKRYILTLRFYDVNNLMNSKGDWDSLTHRVQENIMKNVFSTCEVKMHSTDPSFHMQGFHEDLAKEDLAIYRFKGPRGKDIWQGRHVDSGGLSKNTIRLTKHLSQLIGDLNNYIRPVVQTLRVK